VWSKLTQLKARILNLSDQSSNEGLRILCVKFVETVIATQTPGIKDPRVDSSRLGGAEG
jgi:symplekin